MSDYRASIIGGIKSYKCLVCLLILSYLSVFCILSIFATYYSLGIYYLTQEYYIRNACHDSILWEYVLISTIFAGNKLIVYVLKNFTNAKFRFIQKANIATLFLEASLVTVGGFGLFDHQLACNNDNTNLWKFGIASFLLQIIYVFVSTYKVIMDITYGEPPKENIIPDIPRNCDDFSIENDVFIEHDEDVGSQTYPQNNLSILMNVSEV